MTSLKQFSVGHLVQQADIIYFEVCGFKFKVKLLDRELLTNLQPQQFPAELWFYENGISQFPL